MCPMQAVCGQVVIPWIAHVSNAVCSQVVIPVISHCIFVSLLKRSISVSNSGD